MDVQVILLCGGKGTRLKPYTAVFPKPLMPLGEKPILEIVLRQLKSRGFDKAFLAVGHGGDLIKTFFGDGRELGVELIYCHEERPLGTAGPLRAVEGLSDTFLVMNGDILTTLDFKEMIEFHRLSGGIMTVAEKGREVSIDYGVLELSEEGLLVDYKEKPALDYHVSMGIYVMDRAVRERIPAGVPFDMPDLIKGLIRKGEKICAYRGDHYWQDIGRPEDYRKAVEDFLNFEEVFIGGERDPLPSRGTGWSEGRGMRRHSLIESYHY